MEEIICYLAWEWINISLEYTAVAWARLPRLFWAVAGVNLVTHPVFMFLLEMVGRDAGFMFVCELGIFLVEWLLLVVVYGRDRWRLLGGMTLLMNAVSLISGLLIDV